MSVRFNDQEVSLVVQRNSHRRNDLRLLGNQFQATAFNKHPGLFGSCIVREKGDTKKEKRCNPAASAALGAGLIKEGRLVQDSGDLRSDMCEVGRPSHSERLQQARGVGDTASPDLVQSMLRLLYEHQLTRCGVSGHPDLPIQSHKKTGGQPELVGRPPVGELRS